MYLFLQCRKDPKRQKSNSLQKYQNKKIETIFEYTTLNEIVEDGMKAEKRKVLYKNLYIKKELTMFFGTANVGKSMIAVQMAEEIAKNDKMLIILWQTNE